MSAMKKQKEHVSKEDDHHQTTSSMDVLGDNYGTIPSDLLVEILLRVPTKSMARFHCVSKTWGSLLSSLDFVNLFMKKSLACPRLLFTFQDEGKWSFFSLPQNMISDQNTNLVVIDNHMDVPKDCSCGVCEPVCGLLCTRDEWFLGGSRDARMTICNPSVGQVISLPKVMSRRAEIRNFIGYDPIDAQYKVLCMTVCRRPFLHTADEYQVLTLGMGRLKWRLIEGFVTHHYPSFSDICLNGVIYYLAENTEYGYGMVVCFSVKHETFSFIMNKEAPLDSGFPSKLINYKGKLGGFRENSAGFMDGRDTSFELWVIDTEKQEMSKFIHILPPLWKELVSETSVTVVGTMIVLAIPKSKLSPSTNAEPNQNISFNIRKRQTLQVHGTFVPQQFAKHL